MVDRQTYIELHAVLHMFTLLAFMATTDKSSRLAAEPTAVIINMKQRQAHEF